MIHCTHLIGTMFTARASKQNRMASTSEADVPAAARIAYQSKTNRNINQSMRNLINCLRGVNAREEAHAKVSEHQRFSRLRAWFKGYCTSPHMVNHSMNNIMNCQHQMHRGLCTKITKQTSKAADSFFTTRFWCVTGQHAAHTATHAVPCTHNTCTHASRHVQADTHTIANPLKICALATLEASLRLYLHHNASATV